MSDEGYDDAMDAPEDVTMWAAERSAARSERDFATADELKARIEAAGWNVIDHGTDYELSPIRPPDVVVDGITRYGSPATVPSLLSEPAAAPASVIVLGVTIDSDIVAERVPDGVPIVRIVEPDGTDPGTGFDVVRTAVRFGPAAALEAGLRRSRGEVVIVLAGERAPTGDVVTPHAAALADPSVAIAGAEGLKTRDFRRFVTAPAGRVDALGPACYAFRRADVITHLPADDRLLSPRGVAAWWSLTLRSADAVRPARHAVAIRAPIEVTPELDAPMRPPRDERRDGYRLAQLFAGREELASRGG